jgi:hypothetical protein
MKSIILATGMTLVLMIAVTVVLRLRPVHRRARQITTAFFCTGIVLAVVWWATSDDLGVLPEWLLTRPRWLDLVLTLFFFAAGFFGGILQIYNLADRGLSLRILIDIAENQNAVSNPNDVVDGYSRGRGLHWMYSKRMHDMVDHDFVSLCNGAVSLTMTGYRIALLFLWLRRLCKLED